MFSNKEMNGFNVIYKFVLSHEDKIYVLKYENEEIKCKFLTLGEDENDLDENNPLFEEYNTIYFQILDNEKIFSLSYFNLPIEIYYDNELVFKKY